MISPSMMAAMRARRARGDDRLTEQAMAYAKPMMVEHGDQRPMMMKADMGPMRKKHFMERR